MRRQYGKDADAVTIDSVDEAARLQALVSCDILDSSPEPGFDAMVNAASYICETPISLISLVDQERQWFKASVGVSISETPRSVSFCSHAIREPGEIFVVEDTHRDSRFVQHPLVVHAPFIRFYAGVPLVTSNGHALGTLCVIDTQPRTLNPKHAAILVGLAKQISSMLDQRLKATEIHQDLEMSSRYQSALIDAVYQLEQKNQELLRESLTDPLTGIGNRRGFDLTLTGECERALRANEPLCVLMIDIDRFKNYNDDFGHVAGDQVLIEVAKILRSAIRSPEYLARYGGEEFVIILPSSTMMAAEHAAERIRSAVEHHSWERRSITISVGIAATSDEIGFESIIKLADSAMYLAKFEGRNRIRCSDQKPR